MPKRGIGKTTVEHIDYVARETGITFLQAAELCIADDQIRSATRKAIAEFVALIHEAQGYAGDLRKVVEAIVDKAGLIRVLEAENSDDAAGRIENIQELFGVVDEYAQTHDDADALFEPPTAEDAPEADDEPPVRTFQANSLPDFVEWVTLRTDMDTVAEDGEAITMMTKANILVGMGDGRFDPDAVMTREQFATMIAQLFMIKINQPIGGFIFKDLNGGFADKYISFLYALGILEGKGDNMFGPKDSLTRAQAITVVNKLIGRLPGEGTTSFGAVTDQMKTWPDNMDTTAWYYAAIQEATNSHDYTLDVNFNTFGDLKGDIFQNIKHPVTERWTLIR